MKTITPNFEIVYMLEPMEALRLIEYCARLSYRSVSKLLVEYNQGEQIVKLKVLDTSKAIINRLYNRFNRVYVLDYPNRSDLDIIKDASALSFVETLILNNHSSQLEWVNLIIKFHVNIGFTREQNRHRLTNIIEQSTRYANLIDDRFGNEVVFVKPNWFSDENGALAFWSKAMQETEENYASMLAFLTREGDKITDLKEREKYLKQIPQMARGILNLDVYSPEIIGANLREWSESIIRLRYSVNAHPSMQEIYTGVVAFLRRNIPLIFDYEIEIKKTLADSEKLAKNIDKFHIIEKDKPIFSAKAFILEDK